MKKVMIEGVEYALYGRNESPRKAEPHMEIVATGKVPEGRQWGLLERFFLSHGIVADKSKNTHTLIRDAIKFLEERE